jgi:hypothetical protein
MAGSFPFIYEIRCASSFAIVVFFFKLQFFIQYGKMGAGPKSRLWWEL